MSENKKKLRKVLVLLALNGIECKGQKSWIFV